MGGFRGGGIFSICPFANTSVYININLKCLFCLCATVKLQIDNTCTCKYSPSALSLCSLMHFLNCDLEVQGKCQDVFSVQKAEI